MIDSSMDQPLSAPHPSTAVLGNYEHVVQALVTNGGDKLQVNDISPDQSLFMLKRAMGSVHIVVMRFHAAAPEHTQERLKQIARAGGVTLDIILVGGGETARRMLQSARPLFSMRRIGLFHVADDRSAWAGKTTAVNDLLVTVNGKVELAEVDRASWTALLQHSGASQVEYARNAEELQAFAALVNERKPVGTWAIAGVIAAVFGLELLWGGSESHITLVRMGALAPELVFEGQWWRLISCTFLHAGVMHVLFNVYVLYVLGTFLERIIGTARFLLLYAASALAGSLGSLFFLKAHFSVGASGAVWGLLGAHAILAYRSQGLLPEALVAGARKAALINLGINVLNSFRPQVDMWAHFAGGAAGAAVFASGLLTRGVPRLGNLEQSHAASPDELGKIPTSNALWGAGGIAGLLLLAGLGAAIVSGRPFSLTEAPSTKRTELSQLALSVEIPVNLAKKVHSSARGKEVVFGAPLSDPMTISVWSMKLPKKPSTAEAKAEIAKLKTSLPLAQGAKLLSKPREFSSSGEPGVAVTYRYSSGLVHERAFLYRGETFVRIEVLRWPQYRRAAPAGSAQRIAETARAIKK